MSLYFAMGLGYALAHICWLLYREVDTGFTKSSIFIGAITFVLVVALWPATLIWMLFTAIKRLRKK